MQYVGCLLIDEKPVSTQRIFRELTNHGIYATSGEWGEGLLTDVQKKFYDVQKHAVRACVAAEGATWMAALALAVQLNVDRVALINPSNGPDSLADARRRQLNRLQGYVKRNLFFCVSDVLVVGQKSYENRVLDGILSGMVNARIWSAEPPSEDATVRTVIDFLRCDDFAKSEYVCE